MIPLAGIEGNLIFLIVAAAVGVINWLVEKRKKAAGGDSAPPTETPRQSAPPAAGGESEQERLRRFMEALGVPQTQPPPQQPRPQPQRQAPAPAQQMQRTAVHTTVRQMRTAQAAARPVPKVIRQPKPQVVVEEEEFAEAGRIEEAASAIEKISSEFEAMNVRVTMPPVQALDQSARLLPANAGTTSVEERSGNPLVASLRRTLTNPTDIRAAFLAAELLGPPKALRG